MLPKLLTTSVIRGSHQGESHGGIFLVDMEKSTNQQKFDLNNDDINFDDRGADRGLRGITFYQEKIYIAASDEIFVFDQDFNIIFKIKNLFLKHCHEICIWRHTLYITSTGFDTILMYDLQQEQFVSAIYIQASTLGYKLLKFNPLTTIGPKKINNVHINSLSCDHNGLYFSGRKAPYLFRLTGTKFGVVANIPLGTHNAQCLNGGVIYNDTDADAVCFVKGNTTRKSLVPTYQHSEIINIEKYLSHVARPSFGRGLAILEDGLIAAGSSPSTIALHDIENSIIVKKHTINMDVRNAIHGLAVWPF